MKAKTSAVGLSLILSMIFGTFQCGCARSLLAAGPPDGSFDSSMGGMVAVSGETVVGSTGYSLYASTDEG